MPYAKRQAIMYRHTQAAPAVTWTINHNQGSVENSYPVVDVYIDIDGAQRRIIPQMVTYIDENTAEVEFSEPQTGFAMVII